MYMYNEACFAHFIHAPGGSVGMPPHLHKILKFLLLGWVGLGWVGLGCVSGNISSKRVG